MSVKPERIVSFDYSREEAFHTSVQEGKRLQVPVAHTSGFSVDRDEDTETRRCPIA